MGMRKEMLFVVKIWRGLRCALGDIIVVSQPFGSALIMRLTYPTKTFVYSLAAARKLQQVYLIWQMNRSNTNDARVSTAKNVARLAE